MVKWDSYFLALLLLFFSSTAQAAQPLEVRLMGPKNLLVGERPNLQIQIMNVSNETVEFVPPLDGSWHHWRYPRMSLEVHDENGNACPVTLGGRCGNMNPVLPKDIRRLDPQVTATFSIGWPFREYCFEEAGRYSLTLSYDLRAPNADAWAIAGRASRDKVSAKVAKRLKHIPKLLLNTQPLTVKVRAVTTDLLERMIVEYFLSRGRTAFAFVKNDLDLDRWKVTDIRQSHGYVSCRLQFVENYQPPPRLQSVPPGYWFEGGRYLFAPYHGRSQHETLHALPNDTKASIFKLYPPQEAELVVQKHDVLKGLGFSLPEVTPEDGKLLIDYLNEAKPNDHLRQKAEGIVSKSEVILLRYKNSEFVKTYFDSKSLYELPQTLIKKIPFSDPIAFRHHTRGNVYPGLYVTFRRSDKMPVEPTGWLENMKLPIDAGYRLEAGQIVYASPKDTKRETLDKCNNVLYTMAKEIDRLVLQFQQPVWKDKTKALVAIQDEAKELKYPRLSYEFKFVRPAPDGQGARERSTEWCNVEVWFKPETGEMDYRACRRRTYRMQGITACWSVSSTYARLEGDLLRAIANSLEPLEQYEKQLGDLM